MKASLVSIVAVLAVAATAARSRSSRNWGGAIQRSSRISYVSGILTVPSTDKADSLGASFWVGIDGSKCKNAILQTGIDFDGGVMRPWYEWFPDETKLYQQPISAKAGDRIRMTVEARGPTAGRSSLENLSTGEKASAELKNQVALCLEDAEWIVENTTQGLADFGTARFDEVEWRGARSKGNAKGATVYDLGLEARCMAGEKVVECHYVRR